MIQKRVWQVAAVVAVSLALSAGSAVDQVHAAQAGGALVQIGAHRLYVEDTGPRDAPVLLYLHGGPGAGSYDFSRLQGARLSQRLRLVVIDQRGVLRSDALQVGEGLGVEDLIDDCEALRARLGVARWTVLGHSFGGYVALLYALEHPDTVDKVIFENPAFDLGSSAHALLFAAAEEYRREGKVEESAQAMRLAISATPPKALWAAFQPVMGGLGAARNNLYVHGAEKDFFEKLVAGSGLPDEQWSRAGAHARALAARDDTFVSLEPRLSELKQPALLIKGRYDPVTAGDQIEAFSRAPHGRVVVFESSGHFAHFEEPDRFARVVSDFVLEGGGWGATQRAGAR